MTTNEMRELDAWIAENVMGLDVSKYPIKHESVDIDSRTVYMWDEDFPYYTTDPAAAMEVLKKCCAEKIVAMVIEKTAKGDWLVGEPHGGAFIAETLPLAICLFAKKLFSKE